MAIISEFSCMIFGIKLSRLIPSALEHDKKASCVEDQVIGVQDRTLIFGELNLACSNKMKRTSNSLSKSTSVTFVFIRYLEEPL